MVFSSVLVTLTSYAGRDTVNIPWWDWCKDQVGFVENIKGLGRHQVFHITVNQKFCLDVAMILKDKDWFLKFYF